MGFDAPVAAVRRALEDAGLFRGGAGLLCGVSGGADSVALLYALWRLRSEAGFRLEASHVQHGLRGEASLEDERFVRALCDELGVPLHVENAGLTGGMEAPGMEARARERRARHLCTADGRAEAGCGIGGAPPGRSGRNGADAPSARRGHGWALRHAGMRAVWPRGDAAAVSGAWASKRWSRRWRRRACLTARTRATKARSPRATSCAWRSCPPWRGCFPARRAI